MTVKKSIQAAAAVLAFCAAGAVSAVGVTPTPITLTFEGLGNLEQVGDYYNGGAGGSLGVRFSAGSQALIDADAGGTGDFGNEPSPNTILFFLNANSAILNYEAGFTSGFSFYYSSSVATTIRVFDGLNGTGTLLESITLAAQGLDNCVGDPFGVFCNWTAAGVAFGGVAKSVDFGGAANLTGFDNITIGASVPGCTVNCNSVPEPATLALVGAALLGLSAARRRKV